jgi:O-antigen ligase/tetratricopeptide (TPR) repeat protein
MNAEVPKDRWLDWTIEGILYTLLAFCPLALGAVYAWSEEVVILLAAGLSLAFGLKLVIFRTVRFAWTWAYVPVAVFVLVAALQLLSLPAPLVQAMSPNTAAIKTDLLGDLPNAGETLSSMTLSFYPRATRHDVRLVLAVAAVFVVVSNFYRDRKRIKRLLAALAIIGGGIAVLALMQDLTGNSRIYWSVPTYGKVANSGPFINHSHYGQFMNLSIGAAMALLLVLVHEVFMGHRALTPARVAEFLSAPKATPVKLILGMIVVAVATVFVSLSRGAMVSMLIAAGFTTLMLSWRKSLRGRGWIMVLLALGAFVCVLWVGFDQVYNRLASLREMDQAEGGRGQILKDIALAWTKFPLFGVGLGTHEVVYPMFDRSTIAALAMRAENEYAQAAEETGAVGLLALVFFGVAVWFNYAKSINVTSSPIRSAAYGLGFGLAAILIHSLSDFGQHLPANAVLTAVCCGLLVALPGVEGRKERKKEGTREGENALGSSVPTLLPSHLPTFSPWRLAFARQVVVLILVAGIWVWALLGADRARTAESHWNKVLAAEHELDSEQWVGTEEAYDYLFTHAIDAVMAEPDNIKYRHWLGAYKWLSLTSFIDPNTQQLQDEALPWARQIADELLDARAVCPTFGASYCLAGEIEKFVLKDPNGADHVQKGYQLAPCDPTACFAAARIDAEEGKVEDAFAKLVRAVQLDGRFFHPAVGLCIQGLGRDDLALQLAQEDASRLAFVGNVLSASSGAVALFSTTAVSTSLDQKLAEQALEEAFEQLKQKCEQPDAPASAHASLANLYQKRGDTDAAVQHYRRALMKNYDQVGWHYALAQLLAGQGHTEEAIHEARICLRLRADYGPARRLIQQLSLRPAEAK